MLESTLWGALDAAAELARFVAPRRTPRFATLPTTLCGSLCTCPEVCDAPLAEASFRACCFFLTPPPSPGLLLDRAADVFVSRDLKAMAKVASGVLILRLGKAPEWTSDIDSAFVEWNKQYTQWLTTAQIALEEKAATK